MGRIEVVQTYKSEDGKRVMEVHKSSNIPLTKQVYKKVLPSRDDTSKSCYNIRKDDLL